MQQNSIFPGALWSGAISGQATSIIAMQAIDKNVVAPLLPDGLVTAPQQLTKSGFHPVYFSFNLSQQRVTTPLPFLTLNYAEFALGIPYLQLKDGDASTLFAYSPVLYLNSLLATIGGRLFYSLPKRYSSVAVSQREKTTFKATHLFNTKKEYLSASFTNSGPIVAGQASQNFQQLLPLLRQPLIVHDAIHGFRTTSYVMQGLDSCQLQPVAGVCTTKQFLPGLTHQQLNMPGINDVLMGSFKITYNWHLTKTEKV